VSDLDTIAVRVRRDGRYISAFVSELDYLTAEELENMAPPVKEAIVAALKADPNFRQDMDVWLRVWRHEVVPGRLDADEIEAYEKQGFSVIHSQHGDIVIAPDAIED